MDFTFFIFSDSRMKEKNARGGEKKENGEGVLRLSAYYFKSDLKMERAQHFVFLMKHLET